MKALDVTEVWQRYEKGLDYLNRINLPNKTRLCHRFYDGDQWYGIKSGGEELPSLNFIKGIVKYKATTVAQNSMSAVFTSGNTKDEKEMFVCQALGEYFATQWEGAKLDSVCRQAMKEAAIQGDSYIYFGGGDDLSAAQVIDNVNLFLSDEQNSSIQEQKYVIIRERRFVEDVIKEAEENGISEEELLRIQKDQDVETQLFYGSEVNAEDKGKCLSLLHLHKDEEGYVHICRSVKGLMYQPDTILRCEVGGKAQGGGLKSYPLVNFLWEERKGSSRGLGEVEFLISNQIEINKTLARRSIAVKQTAFPMIAYAENLVNNPEELETIGGKIAINNGNAQSIDQIISYLRPASISPDAKNLSDELLHITRNLAGAGDVAMGNVDPTQASGTAIIAVREQAQLPLNEQVSRYSQLVEDIARLFIDMWIAYHPQGITFSPQTEETEAVPQEEKSKKEKISVAFLEKMKFKIRVDVMKVNPFNLYAAEQGLYEFYKSGAISLEEFVEAMPEGGSLPKNKLREILIHRQKTGQEESSGTMMPKMAEPQLQGGKKALMEELLSKKAMLEEALTKTQ